jgi:lysyl-tRNA synthetase class 2
MAELRAILPMGIPEHARTLTVLVGVLLVLLAHGLARRKRRAWQLVLALAAVSTLLHLLKGLDYDDAAGSAAVTGWLLYRHRDFHAEPDPSSRWRAAGAFVALFALSLGSGLLMLRLGWARSIGDYSMSAQVAHVLGGMVGVHGPVGFASARIDLMVARTLAAMGLLTVAVPTWMALRPPRPRPRHDADDEARLLALLGRHGGDDSLGWFALRRDKAAIWSPSGKSAVAYRVVGGVMLASGDPLGDREAWPGAIAEFLRVAARHAWVPAVLGCSTAGGTAWTRAGLTALELGDEAVLCVDDFGLDGRAMRGVRQAVARVERAGYEARAVRVRDLPAAELAGLRRLVRAWRGSEPERGFSMALGRFAEPATRPGPPSPAAQTHSAAQTSSGGETGSTRETGPAGRTDGPGGADAGVAACAADCVVVTAVGPADGEPTGADEVRGLLHFVPWGRDGLSLDVMVRDPRAVGGLTEYLIVATVRAAAELGVRRISLNFAAFRHTLELGDRLGAGPVARGSRWLLVFLSRWFQIESLYRFNARFQPTWQPRYICFPTSRDLPRVAVAMMEAESYLAAPWRRPRTAKRGGSVSL